MRACLAGLLLATVGCVHATSAPGDPKLPGDTDPSDSGPAGDSAATDPGLAADGGDPAGPGGDPTPACTLDESGPITVQSDGELIEHRRITATTGHAVTIRNHANVIVRDCEIRHCGGAGIDFANADNLTIEDVDILYSCAPPSGANPGEANNISGETSSGVHISKVRLTRGSTGIYLDTCPAAVLNDVEGHDFRGPMPRGQLVQFNHCDDASLTRFSSENPAATAWTEDNVSVFYSDRVTVQDGLVDGNNSPSGVGVMFESSADGLCEDVDAVHQGNGCFSAYPGTDITFRRTRARDNICSDQGRGLPASGGLAWTGEPTASSGLRIESSTYTSLCGGLVWDEAVFDVLQLTNESFTPRAPLRLDFCWPAP